MQFLNFAYRLKPLSGKDLREICPKENEKVVTPSSESLIQQAFQGDDNEMHAGSGFGGI
jgi:hypothetical protein